jgi:hypothetical protein
MKCVFSSLHTTIAWHKAFICPELVLSEA